MIRVTINGTQIVTDSKEVACQMVDALITNLLSEAFEVSDGENELAETSAFKPAKRKYTKKAKKFKKVRKTGKRRKCQQCGKGFLTHSKTQKFCCIQCANKYKFTHGQCGLVKWHIEQGHNVQASLQ